MYDFLTQSDFDDWLWQIPLKLDSLKDSVGENLNIDVTDEASVRNVSDWVVNKFSDVDEIKNNSKLWDELSCFFGEYYRERLSAEWGIELDVDNKDSVFFKKPIIKCSPPPICPMSAVTTMIARNNALFIIESIEKRLKKESKKAS